MRCGDHAAKIAFDQTACYQKCVLIIGFKPNRRAYLSFRTGVRTYQNCENAITIPLPWSASINARVIMKQRSTNISFRLLFTLLFLLSLNACGGGGGDSQTPPTSPPAAPINLWTWMSGSDVANQAGVYGTQGVAATNNVPGGRECGACWTDSNGNFWVFGGFGFDSTGTYDRLNDLWRFDGTNWTWISGSKVVNQSGVYGTQGTAVASNVPGARSNAVSWKDSNNNLWLFGGFGYDSTGTTGWLNDLWKFDGTNWTWISGSDTSNQPGNYGVLNVAAASNVPGGRHFAVSWTDSSDNLWLFGGAGRDSSGLLGELNDLWKFDGSNWTWINGSDTRGLAGVYGTRGTAAATNVPGARYIATAGKDSSDNLWLFGGYGRDSAGTLDLLNDLWKFDGTQWTWVDGSNLVNEASVYGTQGTAAASNVLGARQGGVGLIDSSDNLWLFGGAGNDSAGVNGYLNDLWKYDGSNWTWISGSNVRNQSGVYGTQGTAGVNNVPGARQLILRWSDNSDELWLFGGWGYDSAGTGGVLNDLWRYQP
jgi:N-acetylneuraminic acid mutarotase